MELQFHQTHIPCLRRVLNQIHDVELTQEIKLPDGMPDIGSVISAWAQVLIRSKEWREDRVGVSGGVQAWILYGPEDGTDPRMVEVWMPFQNQWDIPENIPEGKLCIIPKLRLVDGRSVASRRLVARAGVSLRVSAWSHEDTEVCYSEEVPEDVQLKTCTYQMNLPCEIGEKAFVMDEELFLSSPKPEKLLQYSLQPQITEAKVMAGRVVFRGNAALHLLYRTEETVQSTTLDIPFAQYADLEQEYGPEATVWMFPAVTSLDVELGEENKLRLKAGLVAQYIICEEKQLSTVEDAYSTQRELKLQLQTMVLPDLRMQPEVQMDALCNWTEEGRLVDSVFYPDIPREIMSADSSGNQLSGRFHILYYDADNHLRGTVCKWEGQQPVNKPENSSLSVLAEAIMKDDMTAQLQMQSMLMQEQPVEYVCGLNLGDTVAKNPDRPSIILRKAGKESLWQLAKRTGSTVEAIQQANMLDEADVLPERILLIPIC